MLLTVTAFTSCTEDEGTNPGNDGSPVATVYQYEAENPDNDCLFRVATNAAAAETYYLAELKSAKDARNMTPDEYADYVVKNGTKVDVKASSSQDVLLKDLHGLYEITVVAVNGGAHNTRTISFAGLDYKPLGTGTYTSEMFGDIGKVDVEYSEVGNRYRIKSIWAEGYGFAFSPNGSKVTVYPSSMETGYLHPSYGMVSVSDQGSTYDEKTKTFTFNFNFTVSAGSFGKKAETLTLDK